ncbi:putative ABC transport system substrate-binding protein [Enhydrobacter aerosaccus]|uniref:Putative ABC transport system substrate-binding protein n=1 Tax=Enhydrobacter aerosaccus TaxID=225324 RepID=A0A1T4NPX6_9HYPH|nr:ABC transporter substrate-binding protein [Enhydrobacter aerosaccus]SJZ80848.1 putative ABC transport system substrate-binding protein [Enhydrobacter aerosaccus]
MKRRAVLVAMTGVVAIPEISVGQTRSMPEVGFLHPGKVEASNPRLASFAEGLRSKGFIDGSNVSIIVRAADYDVGRLGQFAGELVERKVAVLFAVGPQATREARARTTALAIASLDLESDPVASGFIASLARPGGNLTGLFFDYADFSGKWLELMGELIPGLQRVAALWDPTTGSVQTDAARAIATARGLSLEIVSVESPKVMEAGFRAAVDKKAQAVLLMSSPVFGTVPKQVADLGLRYRLPTISMFPEFAEMGGLITYGADQRDLFRQSGEIVGKILAGARPADLPVERPSRIVLAVNTRTAAALGLTVPSAILLRADQLID